LYEPTRKTEIFIVITMYNVSAGVYLFYLASSRSHLDPAPQQEDDVLFARTMRGVMANIAHLNERERSPIWKDDGWKKVSLGTCATVTACS
jgi:chitin synthase